MKHNLLFLVALLSQSTMAARNGVQAKVEANPMRKIISMLQDMQAEVEREGEVEAEIYEKALCACEGGEKDLQVVVDQSTAAIEEFSAKIKAGSAEKDQLTQEVKDHKLAKTA